MLVTCPPQKRRAVMPSLKEHARTWQHFSDLTTDTTVQCGVATHKGLIKLGYWRHR